MISPPVINRAKKHTVVIQWVMRTRTLCRAGLAVIDPVEEKIGSEAESATAAGHQIHFQSSCAELFIQAGTFASNDGLAIRKAQSSWLIFFLLLIPPDEETKRAGTRRFQLFSLTSWTETDSPVRT